MVESLLDGESETVLVQLAANPDNPDAGFLGIQPFDCLRVEMTVKEPGLELNTRQTSLDASLRRVNEVHNDAYEELLLDVIEGDRSLFLRYDEVEKDGNVKLVFKEFPVLGEDSVRAARAGIAAAQQDRYYDMHLALMQTRGALSEAKILSIAADLGLDVERLRKSA